MDANDLNIVREAPLPTPEHMLGKGSLMPFNTTNSGVRKLMFGTNLDQRLPLLDADVPFISTGFENQFGEYSSSYENAKKTFTVLAKIPKFKNNPGAHYYLIIEDENMQLDVIERVEYKHITESYGYLYNNSTLDSLQVGSTVYSGQTLRRSQSFDNYDNRKDGKNLLLLFNSSEYTMEDAIIISESCSHKLASPLIHKVKFVINDNDIPLNMYGNDMHYRILPELGGYINEGILCILRKEKKEEALFSQSFNRLSIPTVSDEKIIVSGRVVDIDIYCNAPDKLLENPYCAQLAEYYTEHMDFCKTLVETVDNYLQHGYSMTYDLQKLYHNSLGEINGKQFYNERIFSNLNVEITVIESIPVKVGDKVTNRYGGKGVVGQVKPDALMPMTFDGRIVDIEANMCGVYGRENAGQLFEQSLTYISNYIAKAMKEDINTTADSVKLYLDFLEIVSPSMHRYMSMYFDNLSDDQVSEYISMLADEEMLYLDIDPVSETMTIDKLAEIYKRFPWIEQEKVLVPVFNSTGQVIRVPSRRPVVCGYVYYYRLKQYGKEKFSVTSLSATNIKNENSRNKSSKVYKARYSRTPIRFGDMELGNLTHMGADLVVQLLMLYSTSPEGRMLSESMMTGDPFKIDVKLNDTASNRNVEILNAYLKTIGLKIEFNRINKQKQIPFQINPMIFIPRQEAFPYKPLVFYDPKDKMHPNHIARLSKYRKYPFTITPIISKRPFNEVLERMQQRADEAKAAALAEEMENKEKEG